MLEKTYKFLLGAALLCFAFYLVSRIRMLGGIAGLLLLLTALLRLYADAKSDNLPWKKNKNNHISR